MQFRRINGAERRSTEVGGFELEYEVIPEPGTLGLVAVMGVGIIGIRRVFLMG